MNPIHQKETHSYHQGLFLKHHLGCFTCTSAVATRRLDRLERLERLDRPAVKPNKDPPGGTNSWRKSWLVNLLILTVGETLNKAND